MFETNFSGYNKIWRAQKIWEALPPNSPRGCGPAHTPSKIWTTFIW